MVRITSIGREGNMMWCNYYPEGEAPAGFIKVDVDREEIVHSEASQIENQRAVPMYELHAMMRLVELKDEATLPKTAAAIWY